MSTLGRDQTALHSDHLLHFYEFHQNEQQKDIPIFQITTKKSIDHTIFQSTTNQPVLATSGVLTGAVFTPGFDRPTVFLVPIAELSIRFESKWNKWIYPCTCTCYIFRPLSGEKAYLHHRTSPSWLPSLEMGSKEVQPRALNKVIERYNRARQRKHKRDVADAVSSLLSLKKRRIEFLTSRHRAPRDKTDIKDTPETDGINITPVQDQTQPSESEKLVQDQSQPSEKHVQDQSQPSEKHVQDQSQPSEKHVQDQSQPSEKYIQDQSQPSEKYIQGQSQPSEKYVQDQSQPSEKYIQDQSQPSEKYIQDQSQSSEKQCKSIQTDLTLEKLQQIKNNNLCGRLTAKEKTSVENKIYHFQTYIDDPEKVAFYTGLNGLSAMRELFNIVENEMSCTSKALTVEEEFLICLIKLKMNYLFQDIAYHLNVSVITVEESFHRTLDLMYIKLKYLVKWPSRENTKKSMHQSFKNDFRQKVVVVMDCFELFTERLSSTVKKEYTYYSNYRHIQSIKYLIGIAPPGVVTFISEGSMGGKTSDQQLIGKSGVMKNLLPGDIVMVDRGFNSEESDRFNQSEQARNSFTCWKSELHPVDIEKTQPEEVPEERVIGLILRKFRIFEGVIPLEFVKLKSGDSIPTIEKIVTVCCSFANLYPSILPFD